MTKIVKQKIAELRPASRTRPVGRAFASPTRPLETFVNNLLMEVIGDGEREKNKDGQERIILEDSRELETGIYRKEEAANMYIQANSAHPWAQELTKWTKEQGRGQREEEGDDMTKTHSLYTFLSGQEQRNGGKGGQS